MSLQPARKDRVAPEGTEPVSSTRASTLDDKTGADVPPATPLSSTRGPVPPPPAPPASVQRRMTERNVHSAPAKRVGNATKEDVRANQATHSKQVDQLLTDMRSNTSELRAKLADVQTMYRDFSANEESILQTIGASQDSAGAVTKFREEVEGDFELLKHKRTWEGAVTDFLSATLGQNSEVERSALGLSAYLATCLEKGMPSVTPPATAVVSFHPSGTKEMLKVFHADDAAELKAGANLRASKASGCAAKVFRVMQSGEPELSNAHGLDRDKGGQSLAPLKTTAGNTFGVVVSGPPPVPDELLEMMCNMAGPLLEQVWKLERAREAVESTIAFIRQYTLQQRILVYASFKEGATIVRPEKADMWSWQPLVHNPHRPDLFELQLKWKLGAVIGVLEVSCGNYTTMDAHLTVLLHVLGEVLTEAVSEIERLTPGDPAPLSSPGKVLEEFERKRPEAPSILLKESYQQLQSFNALGTFSEISSFESKAVDDDMRAFLTGALCLMGASRKELGSWEACRKKFRNRIKCHEAMLQVMNTNAVAGAKPVPPKEMAKRWTEFNMSIKAKDGRIILNKDLYDRSPLSVQLLIRWVTVARMEHKIEDSIAAESRPPPANPFADKIFDVIDSDGDGHLTVDELTAYCLKEYESSVIPHRLLRILDSDADKKISRDEWRRGFADGVMEKIMYKEAAKAKEAMVKKPSKKGSSKKKLEPLNVE